MYKYRCTCRHNLLVHYNGTVEEVRPNQIIESNSQLDLPFLRWINPPEPPKRGRPKKIKEEIISPALKKESLNVNKRETKD